MGVAGCRIGVLTEDDDAHAVEWTQPEGGEHLVRWRQDVLPTGKAHVEVMTDAFRLPGREKRQAAPSRSGVIIQKGRECAAAGANG